MNGELMVKLPVSVSTSGRTLLVAFSGGSAIE